MKKMNIVFIFWVFTSTAYSQIDPPGNNYRKFKGAVISYQEDFFHAIDSFGELKKINHTESFFVLLDENNDLINSKGFYKHKKDTLSIKYKTGKNSYEVIGKRNNGNREPDFKSIWKYDAIGNITEHCRFYNDTIEEKEIAIYNTKNQIIDYKSYGKNGKLDWQKSFKYDLNGNQIEALIFNSAGYYDHNKFNYNIKNKVIESFSIDRNDKIEFKKTYKYNINGNLSEESTSYVKYEDRNYNSKKVFQYSNKGKITSEVRYNSNEVEYDRRTNNYDSKGRLTLEETPFGKHSYNFDLSGNLLEEIDYYYDNDGNRNIESKSIKKYEYDSKGNWIKKIESYIKSPEIIPDEYTITERIINYR